MRVTIFRSLSFKDSKECKEVNDLQENILGKRRKSNIFYKKCKKML